MATFSRGIASCWSVFCLFSGSLSFAGFAVAQTDVRLPPHGQLPASLDLMPEFERLGLTAHAQGNRDTCSIFAIAGVAELELDRESQRPPLRLSEEFLIWAANEASGMTGDQAMFYKAVHGLNVFGICSDELMPYQSTSGATRRPPLAALANANGSQDMKPWGGPMWSRGRQLFCGAQQGGFVERSFSLPKGGRYRLRVLASAAPDFGIVRTALDGKSLGMAFDLYAGRVCPAGSLELGTLQPDEPNTAGPHRLRVTAAGKNAASQGFAFGLDAVDLLSPAK